MDAGKTGNFIAEKRKAINMSQKDLAKHLNITDKAVSKWERGLSFPDITILIPLSEVLNVSIYDLLTGGNIDE
jgi:transcriptional regulator with XRE-family HTH domain